MLIKRDPIAIHNVGTYTKNQSLALKTLQASLQTHINEILNSYQGSDALTLVDSFTLKVNNLSSIIETYEYYGNYMCTLATSDKEALDMTKQNLNAINTTTTTNVSQTIALNNWRNDGV